MIIITIIILQFRCTYIILLSIHRDRNTKKRFNRRGSDCQSAIYQDKICRHFGTTDVVDSVYGLNQGIIYVTFFIHLKFSLS